MSVGIKKIDSIKNMAVFHDFEWEESVKDKADQVVFLGTINILYGRNYSGKTTLSRILRAMETREISENFENPSFNVVFGDGTQITEKDLMNHDKEIRVFNQDFIRDNLHFISNPDDNIEPFAILGDLNNKIEREIEELENELGSNEEENQTGLYAQRLTTNSIFEKARQDYEEAKKKLDKQLNDKATNRNIGIKYRSEKFGDQNYNIRKLRDDIKTVLQENNQPLSDEQAAQYDKLISEQTLDTIFPFHAPSLNFLNLVDKAESLITKQIGESDKIDELVRNAVLNRWADEGRELHKNKRDNCAFCGNPITDDRWIILEKHFDKESETLKNDIDALIAEIDANKEKASSALKIEKSYFYSRFHKKIDQVDEALTTNLGKFLESLDVLSTQLQERKDSIMNPMSFERPKDSTSDLVATWSLYEEIREESNTFSASLNSEQEQARTGLRLKEVSDYLTTIQYQRQIFDIEVLKTKFDDAERKKTCLEQNIRQKEELIKSKKRELNDEEKGAKKVNKYLNNFFGHQFLTLEAKTDEIAEGGSKRIRFEVIRNGKKAYHLSEGECSLLAFCYFLAKLDDIDTKDSKPIIWIDDPVSSLDSNHIFFVFSLLKAEIVSNGRFEQLFVSTHNLHFLKYLIRLNGKYLDVGRTGQSYEKAYFIVVRQDETSTIGLMPTYMKDYVTEFNYLFHQIHKCAEIDSIDDTNYTTFYNFGNNARKFLEIYLYYKYPDQGMNEETLILFFGEEKIPAFLMGRINNEYSHLKGVFERGETLIEVPEMHTAAQQIIDSLKEKDSEQYSALLKSVGMTEESVEI